MEGTLERLVYFVSRRIYGSRDSEQGCAIYTVLANSNRQLLHKQLSYWP